MKVANIVGNGGGKSSKRRYTEQQNIEKEEDWTRK
jgi:hypothetical protein